MVCDTCEKKLGKLIVPDSWKEGSRNVIGGKDGGRSAQSSGPSQINKLAEKRKERLASVGGGGAMGRQCKICKTRVDMQKHYCNSCAYKKGICSMCGRKTLDTSKYKMSTK